MDGRTFQRLFWFYGILGAIIGIVGGGLILVIGAFVVRLFQEHWR